MKILVLERNKNIAELLIDMLSLHGHEVFGPDTIDNAVSLFELNNYDVIILDVEFQNSAIEVIKRIRKISDSVEFILLTVFGNEEFISDAKQYRIAEVIPRDTSIELLVGIINKIFKKFTESNDNKTLHKKGTILIVDDSALIRKMLQDFLVDRGYEVILATDGREALGAIHKELPDLMLLDITMPKMNGIEVLEELNRLGIKFPVIVITSNTDIEVAKKTLNIGAYDYIAKPINFEYLETSIIAKVMHKTY